MDEKYMARAKALLDRGCRSMEADLDKMTGDHSVAGRLQSGATTKAGIEIYEKHARTSLDQALAEAAKAIEHRGGKWRAAMGGIEAALGIHLGEAPDQLANILRIADGHETPSIRRAASELITAAAERLHTQIHDFRDGWTAPMPKPWKDRHPLL